MNLFASHNLRWSYFLIFLEDMKDEIWKHPVGENNIQHIQSLVGLVDKVIYAWGNNQKEPKWLSDLVATPYCIDISKKGVPKHPLYLKSELQPKIYIRNNI